MIIAVQQPEHLPWLGFFDKMSKCDVYVLLDNVQFKKRYFENRNKVRTKEGWHWITVPVKGSLQLIKDVEIDNAGDWKRKYLGTIQVNYGRARFYKEYAPELKRIIERDWGMLAELNIALINWVRGILGIKTKMIRASELDINNLSGSDLILEICKNLGTNIYISGPDGRNYLNLSDFHKDCVEVVFHDYLHPVYKQLHEPFLSHMSIIDSIFINGEQSIDILKG